MAWFRRQKQPLPISESQENGAPIEKEIPPLTPTNGFATRSQSPLVIQFTTSDGHRSTSSLPVEKHSEGSTPIAKAMAPTTQHASDSSNNGLVDEQQLSPKNETLRGYWAEVVENNEFSLTKQFQQFYHVHDIPPNETQQDQADSKATRTTIFSSADPVSLEGQDRTSEKFHDMKPVPCRLDPGNRIAAFQDSTQLDMTRTAVETASIPSAAADSQNSPSDEDYEFITTTEIDAFEAEYNNSLDWLSVPDPDQLPSMTLFPLIPSTLSSTEPFQGYIKPSKADLQRVSRLRWDVRHLRLEIRGQKSFLQWKEEVFSRKNEKLVKLMRERVAGHPKQAESNLELVSKLFIAYQSHKDECGPLVYEIDDMERRLDVEEGKLTQAEDHLYKRFGISLDQQSQELADETSRADSKATMERRESQLIYQHISRDNTGGISDEGEHSDVESHSSQSSFFSSTNYHPLYVEYQDRVGDVDMLLERYATLCNQKDWLEDQQKTRQRVGLRLQKTDEDFLSNFMETLKPLEAEITEAQNDVRRLKASCIEEGIVDEDDNYIGNTEEVHGDSDAESSVKATPAQDNINNTNISNHTIAVPKEADGNHTNISHHTIAVPMEAERNHTNISNHTIAVPKDSDGNHTTAVHSARTPLVLETSLRGGAGEPLEPLEEEEYQSRINPWLLDNLSCSKREVALLVTILQADGSEPDDETYIDVLRFWETDGAGVREPARPGLLDFATMERLWRAIGEIRRAGYDSALVRNLFGVSVWARKVVGQRGHSRDHSRSYFVGPE